MTPEEIHEALHTVSAGYVGTDYRANRGWEEGVVEQMQRLLRPTILDRLGVNVGETLFAQEEASHRYNIYIDALEELRRAFPVSEPFSEPRRFYQDLLATPIRDRVALLLGRGYQLPHPERVQFVRTFSLANFVLTQGVA